MQSRAPTPLESFVAGSISGMSVILVCHPLDVLRTRIQVNQNGWKTDIKESWKEGGLKSIYKGMLVPFWAQVVYKSVIFFTNSLSNKYIFDNKQSSGITFLSGCIAGSTNAAVVAPVELIRTNMIMKQDNKSVFVLIKSLTKDHGIRRLWYNFPLTAIRDGPGIGFYLLTFEKSKSFFMKSFDKKDCPTWIRLLSGSLSGIAFWTWGLPIDTVKTMIESTITQQQYSQQSLRSNIQSKLGQLKWNHILTALPVAYLRGIPSAAVVLTVYDLMIDVLIRL